MAAHSLGEPGTQMNMRTFHYAGVANVNVTQGLPRLIEIVDARRVPSTPSMDIPLLGIAAEDESVAKKVASEIEITTLLDIADIATDITNLKIVITPNPKKMDEKDLTIDLVAEKLNKLKAVRGLVMTEGFDITITLDMNSEEAPFKKLQSMFEAVKNAKIKGIDGINRAVLAKKEGKYAIVTEGSNLKEVLKVQGVDADNVMTNSILEIADVLGIEAARNSIIEEASNTLSDAGLTVDIRHIMLVADIITNIFFIIILLASLFAQLSSLNDKTIQQRINTIILILPLVATLLLLPYDSLFTVNTQFAAIPFAFLTANFLATERKRKWINETLFWLIIIAPFISLVTAIL